MKDLEMWINNLLNPNIGHRILFGKDITKAITNTMVKQIYCTPEMEKKIREKIPIELQKFEINVVRTYGNDMGKRLRDEFSGIIGITYF
jgi:predicted lipoprotein